jgi:hypothetical protein
MPLPTVGSLWREFWRAIDPEAQLSRVQRTETRRAFYRGYFACLMTVRHAADSAEMSEAGAIAYVEALQAECTAFFALVKQGKA